MIKELIGTITIIFMNNLGLVIAMNNKGILYFIGFFNYVISSLMLFFVIHIYFKSDFYKSLKYPWEKEKAPEEKR